MPEVIPKNSRYIPFVQQKSCCVPACLSMVMYRRGLPLIPQELLGYHLGLTVAPENRYLFWQPRTGQRPPAGYGTQIYNPKYDFNKVFAKLKIPLRLDFHPISKYKTDTLKTLLRQALKNDKDLLVCCDHGSLIGKPSNSGHVCVIDRLIGTDKIRLIDPSANQPKWRVVSIGKLYKAMQYHGDAKFGGLWKLKKTQ